jgi:hypothetical protein
MIYLPNVDRCVNIRYLREVPFCKGIFVESRKNQVVWRVEKGFVRTVYQKMYPNCRKTYITY